MCGIAGALVYEPSVARLDGLLAAVDASAARGVDSFGVVRWSASAGFRSYRRLGQVNGEWIQSVGYPESAEPTIYIHTSRAEPTTEWRREKKETDIPPFVDKGIAVAHNGIIANDEELATEHTLSRTSPIDTAIIPPLIAHIGVWETVAAIKGGAALAIIDSSRARLVLCRNFMPLAITWEPGIVCFASEAAFFPDAAQPFRRYQIWELPPYTGIELSAEGYCGPVSWGERLQEERAAWQTYPELAWRTYG